MRKGLLAHGHDWRSIADGVPGRSEDEVRVRWERDLDPGLIKGPWTREEDDLLVILVKRYGPKKWAVIAGHVPGRKGKQCRERWKNHLDSSVKKTPWTPDEDAVLLEEQQRLGNKWCEIAKVLPGRPENAVKNRWNSLMNRRFHQAMSKPEGGAGGGSAGGGGGGGASSLKSGMVKRMGEASPFESGRNGQDAQKAVDDEANRIFFFGKRSRMREQDSRLLGNLYGALGKSGAVPQIPGSSGGGDGSSLVNTQASWGQPGRARVLEMTQTFIRQEVDRQNLFSSVAVAGTAGGGGGRKKPPEDLSLFASRDESDMPHVEDIPIDYEGESLITPSTLEGFRFSWDENVAMDRYVGDLSRCRG